MTAIRDAQAAWAALPVDVRCRRLRTWRDLLLARAEDVVQVAMKESGKVRFEAHTLELVPAVLNLTYVAAIARDALADDKVARFLPLPRRAVRVFHPRGVCALLSPWNYTLSIPMATLAPALAAGNAVVWKPSEHGTQMAHLAIELAAAAGIDVDLVQLVDGGADAGARVLDSDLDHVTFVGSTRVGREVARRCGERLIPAIIELGGKAPAIVLPDADVERAARAIVFGRLTNLGASCIAVERVLAHRDVFDALFARVATLAREYERDLSAPTAPGQRDKALAQLEEARVRGARVLGPCVDVTGVAERDDLAILRDETFGPALPFVRVDRVDDAIAQANAHPLQLSAYVFGGREAQNVARLLRAPNVVINDAMIHYAMQELPFGGRGTSGFGRVHGVAGLRALCVEQVIVDGHLPISKEPWWMPYDEGRLSTMMRALPAAVKLWDRVKG